MKNDALVVITTSNEGFLFGKESDQNCFISSEKIPLFYSHAQSSHWTMDMVVCTTLNGIVCCHLLLKLFQSFKWFFKMIVLLLA